MRRWILPLLLVACASKAQPADARTSAPEGDVNVESNVDTRPIVVTQTCAAPVDVVWQAITDPQQMPKWFFEPIAEFVPRVGFETMFVVEAEGQLYPHRWTVTEVVPPQTLVYRWRYDGIEGDSTVTWEISAVSSGTQLTLTHAGHETFPRDNPVFDRDVGVAGWEYHLDRLASFVAGELEESAEAEG